MSVSDLRRTQFLQISTALPQPIYLKTLKGVFDKF